jgi:FMN phosphatase YigB (HAD superfamily)
MKQNAIICDLDNTLVDENNDYKPIQNVVDFIIQQAQTNKIIIMTARSTDKKRELALKQLRDLKIPFDQLITNNKDQSSGTYKYDATQKVMEKYNVILFIDDMKENRKSAKKLGIKTKKPENISNKILTKTVWSGIFI